MYLVYHIQRVSIFTFFNTFSKLSGTYPYDENFILPINVNNFSIRASLIVDS